MNRIVFVTILSCEFLSTALLAQNSPPLQQKSVVAHRVGTWPYVDLLVGTLSLNGRYLSSVDWKSGNLIAHDLATGENRQLTHDASYDPTGLSGPKTQFAYLSAMSPDGTQVAYEWFHAYNGQDSSSVDLRIVGIDGSAPRVSITTTSSERLVRKRGRQMANISWRSSLSSMDPIRSCWFPSWMARSEF